MIVRSTIGTGNDCILTMEQWSWVQLKPSSSICLEMLLLESQCHKESSISSTLGKHASMPYCKVHTEIILDHVGSGSVWQKQQESSSMCRYLPHITRSIV